MSNLSITRRCKRGCDFCFAAHERARGAIKDMSPAMFRRGLAYLKRSGIPDVRLLGGEPTEHPAFCDFVGIALEQGFNIQVFSGGLMPEIALTCLKQVPPDRVAVILNTLVPGTGSPEWVSAQALVCEQLGEKVELGLTMDTPSCRPFFMLERIRQYGLSPRVRLGIAHPIFGGTNASLRPAGFRPLGHMLEGFITRAHEMDIVIDLDCGFVPCLFSREFLEAQPAIARAVGSRCNPIIDVLPEGEVIACYALSRLFRFSLTAEMTHDKLAQGFEERFQRLVPSGIFKECALCRHLLGGRCDGGCRARRAMRLRPDARRLLRSSK